MNKEIVIQALEEKIESLSAEANSRKQFQYESWKLIRDRKVEKQQVEIWFRWNDGTLGKNETVKVASATYENISVQDALNRIYRATQNDFGSWVDSAESNGLTLHAPAKNEDGISQGSSYVGDIIIINGDMYEVADWGFNEIDENNNPHVMKEFKNEVVYGRDDDEHRDLSFDASLRREGWETARQYFDSGIQSLESAIRDLKKED